MRCTWLFAGDASRSSVCASIRSISASTWAIWRSPSGETVISCANDPSLPSVAAITATAGRQNLVRHCRVTPISIIAQGLVIVAPPAYADRAQFYLERNCRKLISFTAPAGHRVAGSEIRFLLDQLIRRAEQRDDLASFQLTELHPLPQAKVTV